MPVGAMGVGSVLSAGASLYGSSQESKAQTKAANIAAATQMAMYNQTREDLAPYRAIGSYAGGQLQNRLTELTSPITMDQATLEQTPGYQFNLSQGLKAAQSSAAARGLGLSGAAIKGATTFATGLADSTYQNQFNNAVTNQTNAFNRLLQTTQLGSGAAGAQATANTNTGNSLSQIQTGLGNAQAAATMTGANAVGSAANNLAGYYAYSPIYNNLLSSAGKDNSGPSYWSSGWDFMPKNYGY